jgi:DNA-binding NarL/FixJ family response regulator
VTRARILLADDHKEMRDTIEHLLESEFDIVGAVGGGEELLEAESETYPDVCVLDISNAEGVRHPGGEPAKSAWLERKNRFFTVHEDPDFLQAALDTGALGYVLKSRIVSDLSQAIRNVLGGELFISPSHTLGTDK